MKLLPKAVRCGQSECQQYHAIIFERKKKKKIAVYIYIVPTPRGDYKSVETSSFMGNLPLHAHLQLLQFKRPRYPVRSATLGILLEVDSNMRSDRETIRGKKRIPRPIFFEWESGGGKTRRTNPERPNGCGKRTRPLIVVRSEKRIGGR